MSFLWDAYQQSQIKQLDMKLERLQDAEAREEAAHRVALELDEKVNHLALICRAMFELLQQSNGITDAQLATKMHEIDARDGQADGRTLPRGGKCPKCGATISPRFARCLFCGYKDETASPFLG